MALLKGSCMCGAVDFEFATDELNVTACHCGQCRRWSGNYWASVAGPLAGLSIRQGEGQLGWLKSSDMARRGFCRNCGSALFWHGEGIDAYKDRIAVAAGAIKDGERLKLTQHIFVADKGCYYDIADGLPQLDAE